MSYYSLRNKYSTKHEKNVRISMKDGITLSADIFLPDDYGQFPAVLNYTPYRKEDASVYTRAICDYLAARGFAGIIVDIRGTGESQGITLDEYTLQEQLDGVEVIDWLSHQPWCNGNVGMWGVSYSGFNSIQVAMHAPPALKAIIPIYATDDRYNDDVHYYGGCLIGIEQVLYPAMMVTMNAEPPYPETSGGDWANIWQQHLEGNQPWILNWFRHQNEDDYWKNGSLKTDYKSVKCPVYLVGGWADGYTNPIFHMLQQLKMPHKVLVGPWIHNFPNSGIPGPNIDFLQEMCRWWGQWLNGEETEILQEPAIALYLQEGALPTTFETNMPGKWRFLDEWPPEGVQERNFYLVGGGGLSQRVVKGKMEDTYRYLATVGSTSGVWCPVNGIDGLTRDQSTDDGRSLTYTGEILDIPLEILGAPKAILHVSSSSKVAYFCVKLEDIAPDGSSRLVCRGILNATHRFSHKELQPINPGEIMELEIPLKHASWVFQAGHRIQVAISSSDFPWVWPSPYHAINKVYSGSSQQSRIVLPIVEHLVVSASECHLQNIPPLIHGVGLFDGQKGMQYTQNIVNGYSVLQVSSHSQNQTAESSFMIKNDIQAEFGGSDEHPEAAYAKGLCKYSIIQFNGSTDVMGRTSIRSTTSNFFIDIELKVERDGESYFNRKWSESFPRNLV